MAEHFTLLIIEGQNVRNFPYSVRIRWSRQPNLVPFYLYNRIFESPENIRNDGFPDVRWPSNKETFTLHKFSDLTPTAGSRLKNVSLQ